MILSIPIFLGFKKAYRESSEDRCAFIDADEHSFYLRFPFEDL